MNLYGELPKRKVKCELNITPMIDCIFQLLIYFMVTMKFKELDRKLEADLPKAGAATKEQELKTELWIHLRVRPDSTPSKRFPLIVINQRPMRDWADVSRYLNQLSQIPGARKDPVILAPEDKALQGWVMRILDELNRLKFQSINFKQ